MNESNSFPVEEFYEALMSASRLQDKLENILGEFRRQNIPMIYQSVAHIHQILVSKLEPPLMKFNALNSARIFLNTGEYAAVMLIEVYILPIVFEIAAFKASKKSEEGLTLYFIEKAAAQPTKEVKRIGLNYVLLSVEFIYAHSQVKMYRVVESDEIDEESNFKKIAKVLSKRGVLEPRSYEYYSNLDSLRKTYVEKLAVFNPQSLVDFVLGVLSEEYSEGVAPDLDLKRLIMFGDVFVISPMTNQVEAELNSIDGKFESKKKYLSLLSELIRFGYIESIMMVHSCDFLSTICYQVSKVGGDKDLDEGKYIYPHIDDSHKHKKAFYLEFLKCLETWAHAMPYSDTNEESDCKRIYEYLKFDKKFKFPDNPNSHKFKSQMDIYLRQNSERNEKVVEMIENPSVSIKSKQRDSDLQSHEELRVKHHMEVEELQESVINAMKILEVVGFSKKRYEKEMKKLTQFRQTWYSNLQSIKNSSNGPFNLEMLTSEGQIVCNQISELEKIFDSYQSGKISFEEAQTRITDALNSLQQEGDNPQKSQVSVSVKSKHTNLTNRRELKSRISQKAKNDRAISQKSNISSASQSKSAYSTNTLSKPKKRITFKNATHEKTAEKTSKLQQEKESHLHSDINRKQKHLIELKDSRPKAQQRETQVFHTQASFDKKANGKSESPNLNNYLQEERFKTARFVPEIKAFPEAEGKKQKEANKEREKFESSIIASEESFNLMQNSKMKVKNEYYESGMSSKGQFVHQNSSLRGSKLQKVESRAKKEQLPFLEGSKVSAESRSSSKLKLRSNKGSGLNRVLSSEKVSFENDSENDSFTAKNRSKGKFKQLNCISFNDGNIQFTKKVEASFEEYGFKGRPDAQRTESKAEESQEGSLRSSKKYRAQNLRFGQMFERVNTSKEISGILKLDEKNDQSMNSLAEFVEVRENNSMKAKGMSPSFPRSPDFLNHIDEKQDQYEISGFTKTNDAREDKIKNQTTPNQMLESFYETAQIEKNQFKKQSVGQQLHFKDTVEVKREIIHTGDLSGKSPVGNKPGRMQRLFEIKNKQFLSPQNKEKPNLIEVLSQRNAKKGIQIYMADKEKNRMIENLNLRIKNLESCERHIETKLSRRHLDPKEMSVQQYSEQHRMRFRHEQPSNEASSFNESGQFSSRNLDSKENSLRYKNSRKSHTDRNQVFQIDASQFSRFIACIDENSLKKCCLKNKTLLISDDVMEIGCMSIKKDKFLHFTLFLTPKVFTMKNVKISVNSDQNLSITSFPEEFYQIKVKKQETLNLRILIRNVPFSVPKLTISYEIENLKNQSRSSLELVIPCSFNKLFSFEQVSPSDFMEAFSSKDTYCSKKFKINSKIMKSEKVQQYFPNFSVVKKRSGKTVYGCEVTYSGHIFLLALSIDDKKHAVFEGKNMTGQLQGIGLIEFLIVTLKHLLQKDQRPQK